MSSSNNAGGSFFEPLEERVLFDGVPDAPLPLESVESLPSIPVQIQQAQQHQTPIKELLIIDAGVADNEELLSQVLQKNSSFEILLLNENEDGVAQISNLLQQSESTYSAIHIVSHGDPGEVHLGNSTLSGSNLNSYIDEIASWSEAVTDDADLLFYGCDLAGNQSR